MTFIIFADVDIPVGASGVVNCDYNSTRTDRKNACRVDINNLHSCTLQNKFGYLDAKPCILIKLNRVRHRVVLHAFIVVPFDFYTIRLDLQLGA